MQLRAAGVPVGLGVDGSSSADSASLWMEARQAMLLAKLRDGAPAGTARMALELATLGGAACLGRVGEIGVIEPGAVADLAVWRLTGPSFAGALADPIEAWLRCGPVSAWHTIVNGRFVVREGSDRAPRPRRTCCGPTRGTRRGFSVSSTDAAGPASVPRRVRRGLPRRAARQDDVRDHRAVDSISRPDAVVIGVTLAMLVHSVLAVAVGEALRRLPRTPTQLGVAALFLVGGVLLLRGGDDDDDEVSAAPVHSAWGVIGRSALIIGIAEFGDFTQLATVGIVADRGYAVAVAAGLGWPPTSWSRWLRCWPGDGWNGGFRCARCSAAPASCS